MEILKGFIDEWTIVQHKDTFHVRGMCLTDTMDGALNTNHEHIIITSPIKSIIGSHLTTLNSEYVLGHWVHPSHYDYGE